MDAFLAYAERYAVIFEDTDINFSAPQDASEWIVAERHEVPTLGRLLPFWMMTWPS